MWLASRNIGVNDRRRVRVSYKDFLSKGTALASVTVTVTPTVPPASSSIVGGAFSPSFNPAKTELIFFVQAGAVNETFTAAIQAVDSTGQIVNDTIDFAVVPS